MASIDYEGEILAVIIVILIVSPMGILGWQIYQFLRFDAWISVSVIDALVWCDNKWASNPKEWLGLHRIFDWTPLALAIPILGFSTVYLIFHKDE